MLKKIIIMLLSTILFTSALSINISADNDNVIELKLNDDKIIVNGTEKMIDLNSQIKSTVFIDNGHILVPLRFVARTLGYTVGWMASSETVILTKGAVTIKMDITSNNPVVDLTVGNKSYKGYMDFYYVDVMYDRTHVSLNFIADILNCEVEWDIEKECITITKKDEIVDVDFWVDNLTEDKVNEKMAEEKSVIDLIIHTMQNTNTVDKLLGIIVRFYNDYYSDIFIEIIDNYISNYKKIYKNQYDTSLIAIEFNTIEEAEEVVITLNNWETVRWATLNYKVYPAD